VYRKQVILFSTLEGPGANGMLKILILKKYLRPLFSSGVLRHPMRSGTEQVDTETRAQRASQFIALLIQGIFNTEYPQHSYT